jgi:CRISPR-associated endoribonuclease Cas6
LVSYKKKKYSIYKRKETLYILAFFIARIYSLNNQNIEREKKMLSIKIIVKTKKDIFFKDNYQNISSLIRLFINENNKEMKKEHYEKKFSYYTFNQMEPFEENKIYKKDTIYTFEIRTIKSEMRDLRKFKGLETSELIILGVTVNKIFRKASGFLETTTPTFLNLKKLDKESSKLYKEKIRENILFKYLKNGNEKENINWLRENIIEKIEIDKKFITIPFDKQKNNKNESILYQCYNIKVYFKDNEKTPDIENLIYSTGLGNMTSNGFGFMN